MPIYSRTLKLLRDERGIALPMSLLALLVLSTLVIAFALLASSEPLISTNQKMVAQARSVAESGLERAIWALNNPTDPDGIPDPFPATAPAPYDGSTNRIVVATRPLGQLAQGDFYNHLKGRLQLKRPGKGAFYLTLAVEEDQGSGFQTVAYVPYPDPREF